METWPLPDGAVTIREEGHAVRFRVDCQPPCESARLLRCYGENPDLLLGVLEPQNGRLVLDRRITRETLRQAGADGKLPDRFYLSDGGAREHASETTAISEEPAGRAGPEAAGAAEPETSAKAAEPETSAKAAEPQRSPSKRRFRRPRARFRRRNHPEPASRPFPGRGTRCSMLCLRAGTPAVNPSRRGCGLPARSRRISRSRLRLSRRCAVPRHIKLPSWIGKYRRARLERALFCSAPFLDMKKPG